MEKFNEDLEIKSKILDIWLRRAEWLKENKPKEYEGYSVLGLAYSLRSICVNIGVGEVYTNGSLEPLIDPFNVEGVDSVIDKKRIVKTMKTCNEVYMLNKEDKLDIDVLNNIMQFFNLMQPRGNSHKIEYSSGIERNIFTESSIDFNMKIKIKGFYGRKLDVKEVTLYEIFKPIEDKAKEFVKKLYEGNNNIKPSIVLEIVKPDISSSIWLRFKIGSNKKKKRTFLKHVDNIYFAYISTCDKIDPYVLMDLHGEIENVMSEKIVSGFPRK